MDAIKIWIQKRPLLAFYMLCFAISWICWAPYILTGSDLAELLGIIGVFGPALACVIISRTTAPSPKLDRPARYWLYFIPGWLAATFAFWFYAGLGGSAPPLAALVIFALLGLVPAYTIATLIAFPPGSQRLNIPPAKQRARWGWYIAAAALPVVLRLISIWLAKAIGWDLLSDPPAASSPLELGRTALLVSLYTLIYAGGLNEETGWTGQALPRLLARFSPLAATVFVWAPWMLWHVPLALSGDFSLNAHVLIGSFLGRFLLTWLYIRSSGGLLTAILLHTSVNVVSQFVPLTDASLLVDGVVALAVIIGGRMWQRLPDLSPALISQEDPSA